MSSIGVVSSAVQCGDRREAPLQHLTDWGVVGVGPLGEADVQAGEACLDDALRNDSPGLPGEALLDDWGERPRPRQVHFQVARSER